MRLHNFCALAILTPPTVTTAFPFASHSRPRIRGAHIAAAATRTRRAMVCPNAGGAGIVLLCGRIHRQRRCGDQLSGARDVGFAGGAGEQSVVADTVEALWQNVEQEAPDELVGRQRHGAISRPPVAAVVLVAEGDTAVVEADQPTV